MQKNRVLHSVYLIFCFLLVTFGTSSPLPIPNYPINNLNISPTPNLEFLKLVAGKGSNVYTEVFAYGGNDGSTFPTQSPLTSYALNKADSWFLSCANLDNYSNYLDRRPLNVPDGVQLMVKYNKPDSNINQYLTDLGQSTFINQGNSIKNVVKIAENQYSVIYMFFLNQILTGQKLKCQDYFSTIFNAVKNLDTNGFTTLLNGSTISNSPAYWIGYGVRNLDNNRVSMQGSGWINENGINLTVDNGTNSIYTLSTNSIFGKAINPASSPAEGLSRINFFFPYPISPIINGISPATSNPLPHVTGKYQWDLRSPIANYSLGGSNDFKVSYKIGLSPQFPNIQNTMKINQTKLQTQGILEAKFNVTNIGNQDAQNIILEHPLGADFGKFANNSNPFTIDVIKPGYTLDPNYKSIYNLTVIDSGGSNSINYQAFNLTGWYFDSVPNPVLWNPTTSVSLYYNSTTGVNVTLSSSNGFPQPLIDAIVNILIPKIQSETKALVILSKIKSNLGNVFDQMFKDARAYVYTQQQKFIVNPGDFTLTSRNVALDATHSQEEWFMNATIPSLAVNQSVILSYSISDIPIASETFQSFYYNIKDVPVTLGGNTSNTADFPQATLISEVQNYFQFMQYTFMREAFSGRPLSYLDTSSNTNRYISKGLAFTYENPSGFQFFGLSNGLNIQIADDEAVVAATVSYDKQVYNIGENATVKINLTNLGNLPATNLQVDLYLASLGRDWAIEREQLVKSIKLADLNSAQSTTVTTEIESNSFVGYHPIYAKISYTSDTGQSAPSIPDYYNLGINKFTYGAEVNNIVYSSMIGSLLLPVQVSAEPPIPAPQIKLTNPIESNSTSSVSTVFNFALKIENIGNAETKVDLTWNLDAISSSIKSISGNGITIDGNVIKTNVTVIPGNNINKNIAIEILNSALTNSLILPPVVASYTINGESSLGDGIDLGLSLTQNSGSLLLSASTTAEKSAQKSASSDAQANAFSSSSSIGASVNTNFGGETTSIGTPKFGFLGSSNLQTISLIFVPILMIIYFRKFRLKNK